jgi:hypothetical protein
MLEKLDFMVRFWSLKARHAALGAPLTAVERVELLSLLALMATDEPLPEPGPAPRTENAIEIQITAPHGFVAAELRMVCARGLVVAVHTPLAVGSSTIVRLADSTVGFEYTLPCVVAWGFAGMPGAMGLSVDGAPARAVYAAPESGAWRAPIGWTTSFEAAIE